MTQERIWRHRHTLELPVDSLDLNPPVIIQTTVTIMIDTLDPRESVTAHSEDGAGKMPCHAMPSDRMHQSHRRTYSEIKITFQTHCFNKAEFRGSYICAELTFLHQR